MFQRTAGAGGRRGGKGSRNAYDNYVRAASAVIINSDGENFIYTSTRRPGAGRPGPAQGRGNALFTLSNAISLPTITARTRNRSWTSSSSARIFMRFSSARSEP